MKIIIAPNAFKESLTSSEVAEAIAEGIIDVYPEAEVIQLPLADGGDGTVKTLLAIRGGELISKKVNGPRGERITASYGVLAGEETAVIEMAEASGLKCLKPEQRNPLLTSTEGTGELLIDALRRSPPRIVLGIGGSATVDGGTGMARALGYRFLAEDGSELPVGGGYLKDLAKIDTSGVTEDWSDVDVVVACDVDNPLVGKRGAARVFGPQKGATPEMVQVLEQGLTRLAEVIRRDLGMDVSHLPGAGAAGGLGAGLVAFTGARLQSGSHLMLELSKFEKALQGADLVITGEGRLDHQTAMGKLPAVVAEIAKQHDVPVVALAGSLEEGWQDLHATGVTAAFTVQTGPTTIEDSMKKAFPLLSKTSGEVVRLFSVTFSTEVTTS